MAPMTDAQETGLYFDLTLALILLILLGSWIVARPCGCPERVSSGSPTDTSSTNVVFTIQGSETRTGLQVGSQVIWMDSNC